MAEERKRDAGHYLEDCQDAVVLHDRGDGLRGVAPYALDPANADRLWEESLRLLDGGLVT